MPPSQHCTKTKGDQSDCNSYRGISLLRVAGKTLAQVTQKTASSFASMTVDQLSITVALRQLPETLTPPTGKTQLATAHTERLYQEVRETKESESEESKEESATGLKH